MGKQPETIVEYMNHLAGFNLREVGETVAEYKLRLYHLATEAYRRDYGEAPTEWTVLHNRQQPTVHQELSNQRNNKLKRIRER